MEDRIEELDHTQFLEDLAAAHRQRVPPPGAFTILEFEKLSGQNSNAARDALMSDMEKGIVKGGKFTVAGHTRWYFWEPGA